MNGRYFMIGNQCYMIIVKVLDTNDTADIADFLMIVKQHFCQWRFANAIRTVVFSVKLHPAMKSSIDKVSVKGRLIQIVKLGTAFTGQYTRLITSPHGSEIIPSKNGIRKS